MAFVANNPNADVHVDVRIDLGRAMFGRAASAEPCAVNPVLAGEECGDAVAYAVAFRPQIRLLNQIRSLLRGHRALLSNWRKCQMHASKQKVFAFEMINPIHIAMHQPPPKTVAAPPTNSGANAAQKKEASRKRTGGLPAKC